MVCANPGVCGRDDDMCDIITRKAKQIKKMGKLKQKKRKREREREMMIDGDKKKQLLERKKKANKKGPGWVRRINYISYFKRTKQGNRKSAKQLVSRERKRERETCYERYREGAPGVSNKWREETNKQTKKRAHSTCVLFVCVCARVCGKE